MGKSRRRRRQLNPESKPVADRCFDKLWSKSLNAMSDFYLADLAGAEQHLLKNNPNAETLWREERERKATLYAERCRFQRGVFHVLREELRGVEELVDLLSGLPNAVLPLITCGRIERLTLVDNGAVPAYNFIREKMTTSIRNGRGRVTELRGNISMHTVLPDTEHVVFAETGLTMPSKNMGFPYGSSGPEHSRSGHVSPGTHPLVFDELLWALGERARTLHIFDAPYYKSSMAPDEHEAHVRDIATSSGWVLEEWRKVEGCEPLAYGRLATK